MVQQLQLPHAKFILTTANGRGPLFAASDRTIWRLIPRHFQRQVEELLHGQQFVDALALLDQIDSIPQDEKVCFMTMMMMMMVMLGFLSFVVSSFPWTPVPNRFP